MSIGLQDARGVLEGVVGAGAERYHREEVAAAIAAAGTARLEDGPLTRSPADRSWPSD